MKDTQKERKRWGRGERRRAECGGGTREGERRKELGDRGAGRGGGRKMGTAERWGRELGEKPIGEAGGGS